MKKLGEFVVRRRGVVLLFTVAVTIFLLAGFKFITIDSDFTHSLPPDDPVVKLFNYAGEKFGSNYIAMVGIKTNDIFNYETLQRIKKLQDRFSRIKGVSRVTSIINMMDIRKTPEGIEVRDLFPTIPENREELEKKRKYILSREMYRGKIVSADGTATIIMIKLRDDADKIKVAREIYKIVDEIKGNEKIYYSGFPLVMEYSAKMIRKDMRKLTPLTFLVIMIVLYLSFGSLRGVFIPLGVVFIAILWTFGLMGWVHKPITIITNSLPVILLATGTAYGIHLLNKYNEESIAGLSKNEAIKKAFSETGVPILLAALTTFVGFISMITASMLSIKDFGLFAAIGIIFSLLLTLFLVPPILTFLKQKVKVKTGGHAPLWLEKFLDGIGYFVLKHEMGIVVLAAIIIGASIYFFPRLSTEVNMMNYFPKKSPPHEAEIFMEKNFGGSIPYSIFVTGESVTLKNPFVLKEIEKMEKWLRVLKDSKNPQGISDFLAEVNYNMNGVKSIPETEDKVGNLWFFLEGQSMLEQMITSDNREALLQGFIDSMDTKKIAYVVDHINDYIKKMPHTIFPVKREEIYNLPDGKKKIILNWKLNDILERLNYDLLYLKRNYPGIDTDIVKSARFKSLLEEYLSHPEKLPPHSREKIISAVKEYLNSDEAEVELTPEQQDKVLKFYPLFITGAKDLLAEKLINMFPGEDHDDLTSLASSIIDLTANKIAMIRARFLLGQLKIPASVAEEDKGLLIGDLWGVNETVWGIPGEIVRKLNLTLNEKPVKFRAQQMGMSMIMEKLRRQLIKNMASSVLLAMFLVFLMLSIQLKSFVGGIFSLSAIIFTIMANFLIMALFGIPLDNVTVLFGSIAVGIGIDYTIHFISRLKLEVKKGLDEREAIARTMSTTGVAIVINTVTVAAGFLVLLASSMVPMKTLGGLVALTMFWSALGAITIYPAIVLGFKLKFLRK